jgi:GDP-fucose transporter C1
MVSAICMIIVNKWVLVKTTTPLFFLLAQLLIAVVLFLLANALGLFKINIKLKRDTCLGLWPMIFLNVLGLR